MELVLVLPEEEANELRKQLAKPDEKASKR